MLVMVFVFMPLPEPDISGLHKQDAWFVSFEKEGRRHGLYRIVWYNTDGTKSGEGTLVFDCETKIYTLNSKYRDGIGRAIEYNFQYRRVGHKLVDARHPVYGQIELQLRK